MKGECGSVFVEFALVSLALTMILAATIDFGRLMFSAQGVQDVARVAARELAITPLPANLTFDGPGQTGALTWVDDDPSSPTFGVALVRQRIFNPACLVINLADPVVANDPDAFLRGLPIVNKALETVMIGDRPNGANLLRYPGALLTTGDATPCDSVQSGGAIVSATATGLTVKIPYVRDSTGELIAWLEVLEEIRPDPNDPTTGPFSLSHNPALPNQPIGLAAVRVNYPFQAGAMTAFHPDPDDPILNPSIGHPILTSETTCDPPPGFELAGDPDAVGPFAGPCGLGRQLAFGGQVVRPFRKVVSAQAIYRREVFQ
jgi:hypothetical protein